MSSISGTGVMPALLGGMPNRPFDWLRRLLEPPRTVHAYYHPEEGGGGAGSGGGGNAGGTPGSGSGQPSGSGGNDNGGAPAAGGTPAGSSSEPPEDTAGLRNALEQERKARRDAEKKLRDALPQAERDQHDLERLRAQEAAWASERNTLRLENAVIGAATRLGFADPTDAVRLLDAQAIERNEDGSPKNVEAALRKLLEAKPYLASGQARPAGSADGGTRGTPAAGGTTGDDAMNNWMRDQVARRRGSAGSLT